MGPYICSLYTRFRGIFPDDTMKEYSSLNCALYKECLAELSPVSRFVTPKYKISWHCPLKGQYREMVSYHPILSIFVYGRIKIYSDFCRKHTGL
jgi:hypothetical protein